MRLVFDIGASNIRVGVSRDGKTLARSISRPTPSKYAEALTQFRGMVAELIGSSRVTAAAGGVAALLSVERGVLLQSPNLPGWKGKRLARDLSLLLSCTVMLHNDCALAALGEALRGAGRGRRIVAYIGIGTGIGGARVVDGRIDATSKGFAPGQHVLVLDPDLVDHSGMTWEDLASGSAIKRMTGKDAHLIRDSHFWRNIGSTIGVGLLNVIAFWSPDVIVLGGSVTSSIPMTSITATMRRARQIFPVQPLVVRSTFGDNAALVGGLLFLHTQRKGT